MTVKKVWNNEKYDPDLYPHDISILQLPQAVSFSSAVGAACLPDASLTYGGRDSVIAGWGDLGDGNTPEDLMKVEIPLGTDDYCKANAMQYQVDSMICNKFVRGKDSCQGDSGGPVMVEVGGRHHLVGLVSFGPSPCAQVGPGINTRVTNYLKWIKNIISNNGDQVCS